MAGCVLGVRCRLHRSGPDPRVVPSPHRAPATRSADWRRFARGVVARHVAERGWTCDGWMRAPHPSTDLTVDKIWPGTLAGGVQVLCSLLVSAS